MQSQMRNEMQAQMHDEMQGHKKGLRETLRPMKDSKNGFQPSHLLGFRFTEPVIIWVISSRFILLIRRLSSTHLMSSDRRNNNSLAGL